MAHFTRDEATAKFGRRVTARDGCRAPKDTPGVVGGVKEVPGTDKYQLGIQWFEHGVGRLTPEWFTRDEYERRVLEAPVGTWR